MRYELPGFKPKPKARPQKGRGVMFVPKEYKTWKQEVRDYLAATYGPTPLLGWVGLHIEIHGPNRPRGDRDNLAGGLMDALQPPRARGDVRAQRALEHAVSIEERLAASPGCLYGDDAQVDDLRVRWVKSRERKIVLEIWPLEEVA